MHNTSNNNINTVTTLVYVCMCAICLPQHFWNAILYIHMYIKICMCCVIDFTSICIMLTLFAQRQQTAYSDVAQIACWCKSIAKLHIYMHIYTLLYTIYTNMGNIHKCYLYVYRHLRLLIRSVTHLWAHCKCLWIINLLTHFCQSIYFSISFSQSQILAVWH